MVVPPLPVEIIEHIIKQSLPPLRFDTFEERYRLLRTFSLVDSWWRVLAQKELSRHLVLQSGKGRKFSDSPASRAISLEYTKSLWSRSAQDPEEPTSLRAVRGGLKRCTLVDEVHLDQGVAAGRLWSSAQHLRSFTGNCIDFALPAALPPLSILSSLFLSDPLLATPTCAWSRFLNPVTLPSLRCLKLLRRNASDFVHGDGGGVNDLNEIFNPILSLAPQLETLAIHERGEQVVANRLSSTDWQRFTELQHLTVGRNSSCLATWIKAPESMPPKLRSLTVLDLGGGGRVNLLVKLEGVVAGWEGGKGREIFFKRKTSVMDIAAGAATLAQSPAPVYRLWLARAARKKGIVVREVLAEGSFDHWETFFDVW